MHGRSRTTIDIRPSHAYDAGTDHVGFSPTRQTLLAPSAKRVGGGAGQHTAARLSAINQREMKNGPKRKL